MIDFDDKERFKLKQYFSSLDEDGSGSIGIDELEDPLISLGIAESKDDVKKIIDTVDDDKSGQIEFKEFLDIIKNKNSDGTEKDNLIIDFFKDMINGNLGEGDYKIPKSLPFSLIISTIRRKKLLGKPGESDCASGHHGVGQEEGGGREGHEVLRQAGRHQKRAEEEHRRQLREERQGIAHPS